MLYMPSAFAVSDNAAIVDVMRRHPFATLLSVVDGEAAASHIPLFVESLGDRHVLWGHLSAANPHGRAWQPGDAVAASSLPVIAIFQGPSTYVSPSWYQTIEAVPTWNYIVVHVHGRAERIDDSAAKEAILKRLIDEHDVAYRHRWDEELSEAYRERQKAAIVGLRIDVERIEAKFKLSQNRPAVDRAGVLAAMERGGEGRRELGQWMRRLSPNGG